MMYNYCTLFDSNYLTRGLAMYESLMAHSENFHIYIFAFDDKSCQILKQLNLKAATIISLREFEDEALLRIKSSRTAGEYCWTCTPATIKYCIETYELDNCTYLDADLYFFSDPSVLIEEMGSKSVLITEHRYSPQYDHSATSGIYCVQFMTFKNDQLGREVLNWWRNACLDWCYARVENGKFGDQKYLDDWTTRFECIHVLKHLGGGVAPWNIQQYDLRRKEFELIFYHFHYFKFLENSRVDLGGYSMPAENVKMLYKPYIRHLEKINQNLKKIDINSDFHGTSKQKKDWKTPFRIIKRWLKGCYNVYEKKNILE